MAQVSEKLKYKVGQFVVVRHAGAAKIEAIIDGTYFMFFSNGKRGQGWLDHHVERPLSEKEFWKDWRHNRSFN